MSNMITINVTASEMVRLRIAVSRQRQECGDRCFDMMMERLDEMKNMTWTDAKQEEWDFWYAEERGQEDKWEALLDIIKDAAQQNKRFANKSNPFIKE